MSEATKDIRITDRDTQRLVHRIQRLRGDSTSTKTAMNLIRERATQLEALDEQPGTMGEVGEANASVQG